LSGALGAGHRSCGKPTLRARDLAHSFGEGESRTTVLRQVDLDLHRGQLVLLMGPSGSGKSTLLANLSGLLRPEAGQVWTLVKDPDFCFADEPTGALDWEHGRQVIDMLGDIAHERGATVLVVTHDARLVPYADRIFHLDNGRLSEEDAGNCLERPAVHEHPC